MKGYIDIEKYRTLEAKYKILETEQAAFKKDSTQQITDLKFQLEQLKRMVFGAKSERYIAESPDEQLSLFGTVPKKAVEETVEVPAHQRKKSKPKKKPARLVLPDHLKREEKIIEPDIDLTDMVRIGESRSEVLHYKEAELKVVLTIRPKYIAKKSTQQEHKESSPIVIADLPARFIDKCIADESLLRVIITDKYLDHLPLYRIQARFKRLGMVIPSSTMCGWVAQSADRLAILHKKLVEIVLASSYLQVDETRMEVLPGKGKKLPGGKPKKRKTHRGYQWGYTAMLEKLMFFDYSPRRTADNPIEHLQHFEGVLQTDCYDVYDKVRKLYPNITHYHCLNHARREFEKTLGNDARLAGHALEKFQALYAIERKAREDELDADDIYALRQKEAKPILDELFTWMDEQSPKLPPGSPIAKAMGYMLKRRERMTYYLQDGRLHIDTNPIENLIRPIAVGRRNFLFAGSHEGARRAAIFYSFFACCKLNEVNPVEWLTDVMTRLPQHPVNRIEELLPHLWKKNRKLKG